MYLKLHFLLQVFQLRRLDCKKPELNNKLKVLIYYLERVLLGTILGFLRILRMAFGAFFNGCYDSWACGQLSICKKRHTNKASGSILCDTRQNDPLTLFAYMSEPLITVITAITCSYSEIVRMVVYAIIPCILLFGAEWTERASENVVKWLTKF